MINWSFIDIFSFIQTHGYGILLLGTILEGPVVTAAGAFAASLGLFNLGFVIIISFLGDIIGDTIYFFIGRYSGRHLIDKHGHKFGLKKKRMKSIELKLKQHFFKTLVVLKLTPMLAPPGLMLIGASRISFKRFLLNSLAIIIPASLLFATLGYTLGLAADSFFKYYKLAREFLLVIVIVVAIIAYGFEKKIFSKIAKRIEKV